MSGEGGLLLWVEVPASCLVLPDQPGTPRKSPSGVRGAWSSVYATVALGNQEYKTDKSAALGMPRWSTGPHAFAIEGGAGATRQHRHLEVKVFDTGPFKQDEPIGSCVVELDCLWRPDGSYENGGGAFDRWVSLQPTNEGGEGVEEDGEPIGARGGAAAGCGGCKCEIRVAARLAPARDRGLDAQDARGWLDQHGKVDQYDEFGAPIDPRPAASAAYRCFRSHAAILEERAQGRWVSFVSGLKYDNELRNSSLYAHLHYGGAEAQESWLCDPRTQLISELVEGGVPASLRSKMWPLLTGAAMMEANVTAINPDYYQGLVRRFNVAQPAAVDVGGSSAGRQQRLGGVGEQIDTDLHRTFAQDNNWVNTDEGRATIRRVLGAHAAHNKAVGYCQSMNYVVAHLLIFLEESEAFWVLASVVENFLPGYYEGNMTGVHTDLKVMKRLLHERRPDLAQAVERLAVPLELLCSKWLLCMFGVSLPRPTVYRLWDVVLWHGSHMLLAAALTSLELLGPAILAARSFDEVVTALGNRAMGMHWDAEAFVRRTLKIAEEVALRERLPSLRAEALAEAATQGHSVVAGAANSSQSTLTSILGSGIAQSIDLQSVVHRLISSTRNPQPAAAMRTSETFPSEESPRPTSSTEPEPATPQLALEPEPESGPPPDGGREEQTEAVLQLVKSASDPNLVNFVSFKQIFGDRLTDQLARGLFSAFSGTPAAASTTAASTDGGDGAGGGGDGKEPERLLDVREFACTVALDAKRAKLSDGEGAGLSERLRLAFTAFDPADTGVIAVADFTQILKQAYLLNHPYIGSSVVDGLTMHAVEHYLEDGSLPISYDKFREIMLDHPLILDCFRMEGFQEPTQQREATTGS